MGKAIRPLSVFFLTKDDTPERILFMYPYSTENSQTKRTSQQLPFKQITQLSESDTRTGVQKTNQKIPSNEETNSTSSKPKSNAVRSTSLHQEPSSSRMCELKVETKETSNFVGSRSMSSSGELESDQKQTKRQSDNELASTHWQHGPRLPVEPNDKSGDENSRPEDEESRKREKRTRLPIKVISAMLRPVEELSGIPFEVKIHNVCYVGVPWHISRTAQCIAVVFVLPAACSFYMVEAYQNLSRKLSIAINTEQTRCGFLRDEMQLIQPFLDRLEDLNADLAMGCAPAEDYVPYADIERHSVLARTLRQVYEDVYNYDGIVDVFVNDCVQVGFCVDPKCVVGSITSPIPIGDVENIIKILQPYHTILFYEDCVPGPDSNPYVLRFFEFYDVERSLGEICLASKMPLQQVKAVAQHYILWARAKIVYPLCNTNVYTTIDSKITTSRARNAFRRQFGQDVRLGSLLSAFHPPTSLGQFIEEKALYSSVQIRKQMILFLLRNNYITQLHRFVYLMCPDSTCVRFASPPTEEQLGTLSNRIKTQIRQFKQTNDLVRTALYTISVDNVASGMSEGDYFWFLSTFISLQSVLTGDYHIEAIMFHQQIDRSTLMRILDIFADLVVTFMFQDFVFPRRLSYPKRRYFV